MLNAGGTAYAVTQYSYDADGRPDCTAQRMNPATFGSLPSSACTLGTAGSAGPDRIARTAYDAAGRPIKATSAYGTGDQSDDATATYSDNGRTASVTDAEGNRTSYGYDRFDRPTTTTYPSTTKGAGTSNASDYEQLGYDGDSRVTSRRLRDGTTIGYTYDALGRVITKDLPGAEPDVAYTYDLLDRPLTAATSAQTVSFSYDALGRNLTQAGPQGTVTAAYDLAGRRTQLTYPGGSFYVTYDYDATGNLTAIKEAGTTALATFAYDDLGRRTSLTRGNGVVTSYGYDAVSRLSSLGLDLAGTSDDLTLGYSYNPASQIAGTTRSNDGYAWTGAVDVTRAYASNGLNQYSASGATSLGYDGRGNLTMSGSSAYTYSSENLLLTGPGAASLSYDPLLRLYQTSASGFTTTRFAYDGDAMIAEYDTAGALQKRYVFGPGDDEPLVEYDASGNKTYLAADERGSIVARTDASGAASVRNSYDEYGIPAATNNGRFQYTGQAWFPELGMQYSKARMYSPTLGRFMQTDPIGYGDGMNWYNYVGGDPVNGSDPRGLDDIVVIASPCPQHTHREKNQGDANGCVANPLDPDCDALCLVGKFSQLRLAPFLTGDEGIFGKGWPQTTQIIPACLSRIDGDTALALGLDAVGVVASLTGLKTAWTLGSAAVGATAAVVSVTVAGLSAGNRDQAVALGGTLAAVGAPLIPEGAGAASKAIAESLPGVGVAVSTGVLAYDGYNALKKVGCF